MDIKPIETVYNVYRFRSRAEARWAVFFDCLSIKYIYEPEGVMLTDGTLYLPDFYLPDSDAFFEVKGIMSDKDMHKIKQLITDSGKAVHIGYSDMTFQSCDDWWENYYELTDKRSSYIVQCAVCGKYYFAGINGSYACQVCGAYDGDHYFNPAVSGDHSVYSSCGEQVMFAINKARQARFEHGEKPVI